MHTRRGQHGAARSLPLLGGTTIGRWRDVVPILQWLLGFAVPHLGTSLVQRIASASELATDLVSNVRDPDWDHEPVHVVYSTTSDQGNFYGLMASMLSVCRHLKEQPPADVTLHIICPEAEFPKARTTVACFEQTLRSAGLSAPVVELHALRRPHFNTSVSGDPKLAGLSTVFAKFYLPEYFPKLRRVLWLDPDTIIRADISALFRLYLTTAMAAVVAGPQLPDHPQYHWLNKNWPNPRMNMFNSGVMVIDLDRWKADNITHALEAGQIEPMRTAWACTTSSS